MNRDFFEPTIRRLGVKPKPLPSGVALLPLSEREHSTDRWFRGDAPLVERGSQNTSKP